MYVIKTKVGCVNLSLYVCVSVCVFGCKWKTIVNTTVYITAFALVTLPQDYIIIKSNFEESVKLHDDCEWKKVCLKQLMSAGIE